MPSFTAVPPIKLYIEICKNKIIIFGAHMFASVSQCMLFALYVFVATNGPIVLVFAQNFRSA